MIRKYLNWKKKRIELRKTLTETGKEREQT